MAGTVGEVVEVVGRTLRPSVGGEEVLLAAVDGGFAAKRVPWPRAAHASDDVCEQRGLHWGWNVAESAARRLPSYSELVPQRWQPSKKVSGARCPPRQKEPVRWNSCCKRARPWSVTFPGAHAAD